MLHGQRSIARAGVGFLGFCLTAILFLTLMPVPERWSEKSFLLCILCDRNAVRDALQNILLFLPWGVALAFRSDRILPSVLFGTFVSLAIEMTQFIIPGRDPSLQDVCCNTLGTFLGFGIARSSLGSFLADALGWCRNVWEQWKRPHRALANRLMCGAALISTIVFGLTGWLLAPIFSHSPHLFAGKEIDGNVMPLRIGANGDKMGYFRGAIDEVRIYHRVLAPEEIQADMERPVSAASPRSSPGLVAAYGFDEGSDNRILDASGQGNDGVLVGALRAAGRFGRALVFDGPRDQVLIPHASVLNLRTSFTLEAWIRPEVTPNPWPAVIQKEDDRYFLYAGDEASLVPSGGGTFGGANEGVAAPEPLAPGVWSHLAASYDGSALQMYINGHFVASFVRWFQGRIDEISVGSTEVRPGFVDTRWLRRPLRQEKLFDSAASPGPL